MGEVATAAVPPLCRIPPVTLTGMREEALHVLLWQARGGTQVTTELGAHTLRQGTAVWIPVGCRHGFTVGVNSVTVPLFFDVGQPSVAQTPQVFSVHPGLQTLLLAYAVSSSTSIKPPTDLGQQILDELARSTGPDDELPMPLTLPAWRIAEALRANPGDTRSVDQLAASVHTSSRTVQRLFRSETAMTLREWRLHNRMLAAARSLRTGRAPDVVAHRLGYTSVNAFRRVFGAHHGISPTEYARRYVEG